MRTWVLLLALLAMLTVPAIADRELAPYAYVTAARAGQYIFHMLPGDEGDREKGGRGACYRLAKDGSLKRIWSTEGWYAFTVFLSLDGQYLVRLGNWPRGHAPSAEHLAVAFYKEGKLLKSYSTKDLIQDVAAVKPSVSHYEFFCGEPRFEWTDTGCTFVLETVDKIVYAFDIATGEIYKKTPVDDDKTYVYCLTPIENQLAVIMARQPEKWGAGIGQLVRERTALQARLLTMLAEDQPLDVQCIAAFLSGLYRFEQMAHPLALCITLKDTSPNPKGERLWSEYPAVEALIRIGNPAIPEMVKGIETSDNADVRTLSAKVIRDISGIEVGRFILEKAMEKQTDAAMKERLKDALTAMK